MGRKILEGIVSEINYSRSSMDGTSNQVATFQVGKKAVYLETTVRMIQEGDHIILSGKFKNGMFYADIYKNVTREFFVGRPFVLPIFMGLVLMLPVVLGIAIEMQFLSLITILPAFLILGFGVNSILYNRDIRDAAPLKRPKSSLKNSV